MGHEGLTAVHARGRRHRDGLQPPRGPAEGGEEVFHALTLWQWPHHVQMNGGEPPIRHWEET